MYIKEVLFLNPECEVENLYEVNGGVIDVEDGCITFDGLVWRDARRHELDVLELRINSEKLVEVYESKEKASCIDEDDGYHGKDIGMYSYVPEDSYVNGVGIGFSL